jgi:asparagine synthase (glutamine-hydrolysing)
MRRLSIIDLAGGHQPVFNEYGTIAVVCNGEIYNFRELRHQLETLGHVFCTRSDTEVIVHAYEQWGADCVCRLRGMFSLAIQEAADPAIGKSERLILARDRLGIKPLYYTCGDGSVLFASEVKALLATGRVPRRLSLTALDSYLLFGSLGEPMTLIEGVYSLPPGHRILLDAQRQSREVCPEPYWDFAASVTETSTAGITDRGKGLDQLRPLLEEAVRLHLIADVPVGIFLSGGIDSTALAALASREQSGVRTFTVVFPEEEFSEAEVARRTARKFGTAHQELLLSGDEMLGRMDEAVVETGANDVGLERRIRSGQADAAAAAEIDIEIFELGGPRSGNRGFDAATPGPAGLGRGRVGEASQRRLDVAEGRAAGHVRQETVERIADAAARGGEPVVTRSAA